MSFNGLDLESMFAEAAGAAEENNEKIPGKTEEPKKVIKPPVVVNKIEEDEDFDNLEKEVLAPKKEEPKPQPKPQPKVEKPFVPEKRETRPTPVIPTAKPPLVNNNKDISVESIDKILEMQKVLEAYNATEKQFVMGYFQVDNENPALVIYNALTSDPRDLEALDKIVTARNYSAADRAFYLMDLDNNSIEAIYEQVDLLTGELGDAGTVNERNKIKVCRALEKAISSMPNDVFSYIDKLQEFTKKAIS